MGTHLKAVKYQLAGHKSALGEHVTGRVINMKFSVTNWCNYFLLMDHLNCLAGVGEKTIHILKKFSAKFQNMEVAPTELALLPFSIRLSSVILRPLKAPALVSLIELTKSPFETAPRPALA